MPFSSGASILATLVAVVHSQSASIFGVSRLHLTMRVKWSTSKTVARNPGLKRHINFFSGQSKVPPAFLKLWKTRFLLESAANRNRSGSMVNV